MTNRRKALIGLGAAALVALPLLAAERTPRLSPACRADIRALCASDGALPMRGALRQCLAEQRGKLSDTCRSELRDRAQQLQQRGERIEWRERGIGRYASARVSGTVIYGGHLRQQVDLYAPDQALGDAPLIVYIHGGGWQIGNHKLVQEKPGHFTAQGYVFASAGYRLLPDAPVEQQAADLGEALRVLRAAAEDYGFDPNKIVLMGHSAGAHLAALIATDPKYAGDAFGAIRGAVLLDGAGYDVALAIATPTMEMPLLYRDVFGTDPARHKALSPVTHAGGKDAPDWLALYVATRANSKAQSERLVAALVKGGARAEAMAISGTDHGRMNREIGTEAGAAQTEAIDAFLARIFAR
jgi:arylformamidase